MTDNPYSAPKVENAVAPRTDHDRYIHEQVEPLLEPGERVLYTIQMLKAPALWLQMLFAGLIMLFFIKHYLAAVTDRRIILIRTKTGMMRPKMANLGTESIWWRDVTALKVGGIANNRSLDFKMGDGTTRTLRMAPWAKFVSGNKPFFELAQNWSPTALAAIASQSPPS